MREINLINEIEYNRQYREIDDTTGKKIYDGNSYIYDKIELTKEVYKAEEIVYNDDDSMKKVENVKHNFIKTFENRGGATREQINFAEETAKIVFGKLKEDVTTVIPAPCGFGKSSITFEILKETISKYKTNECTDGMIIVTDRLESLRNMQDDLKNIGLTGYTYILEGWNEEICMNKKIKQPEIKTCTRNNCSYYGKCKICRQQKEQEEYPILMITNARLKECGTDINKKYKTYKNGVRNLLIIDERPDILDTVKVNKGLLNAISTEISKCEYENKEDKTKLENMFFDIQNRVVNKMQELRQKYKRFIVSNINNLPICLQNEEFMKLWKKYMGWSYRRELEHIHTVLTKGGLYVYEKNTEFISTIGSKKINEMYDNFKTIIFDGTALYDPLYTGMYKEKSIKYLDIENTRKYDNLKINAYMKHKLTKTTFKDKQYLIKACGSLVNEKIKHSFNKKIYVVTYQAQSVQLAGILNRNKVNIPLLNDNETYYFGNTKGKNDMQNCSIMYQFGWDTMPDYEYVIQWLSVAVDWAGILQHCNDIEKAESISDDLIIKDRSQTKIGTEIYSGYNCYEFGTNLLNHFKMLSIVTNFYQEVHRTKLRNYSCNEPIEVNVFYNAKIILLMLKKLFCECDMNIEYEMEFECFKTCKIKDRKNEKLTASQQIIIWLDNWDGKEIKTRDMLKSIGITQRKFDKVKEKNKNIKEILSKYMIKQGIYKKVS